MNTSQISQAFRLPQVGAPYISDLPLQGESISNLAGFTNTKPLANSLLIRPSQSVDQSVLRSLNIKAEDISVKNPIYLSKDDLRQISFDTILDQPYSINSLFSDEMKDLVKNLVEMQKSKFNSQQILNGEQNIDSLSFTSISETSKNGFVQLSTDIQQMPSINHLLNTSLTEKINEKNVQDKSNTNRQKPTWEEQADVPYFEKSKRQTASLAKKLLSKFGKGLESFSKILQEASK